MAGLTCDVCQEPTYVLSNGELGTDADDRVVYRRFRTCVNPTCEQYLIRRESLELMLPPSEAPKKVNLNEVRDVLPPNERSDASQPTLFETS